MSISTLVLLTTLSIFITSELFNLKKTRLEDLSTLADLMGKNSYAALMFFDKKAANENLASLQAKPHITAAHFFTLKGGIFSEYQRKDLIEKERVIPPEIIQWITDKTEGHAYINDEVHLIKPIIFERDHSLIGFIHIQSDQNIYWQTVNQYIYTTLIMVSVALLLALIFAYQAQKIFTDPILKLLQSMYHVTTKHQYTMKVKDHDYHDEFGELIKYYNNMLAQLEEQHQLTTHYQSNLENRVEERTHQLKKARDEALSASRLKSIFLANMSHEIRTPMNAILGYAQLLQQSQLNSEQTRKLKIIDKSGNHLLELINDILELSKIEAGSLEISTSNFNLLELIQSVENMFKIRCDEKDIQWSMHCFTQSPVLVKGDQGKLRQILINLLANACKFTDKGEVLFKVENLSHNRYKFLVKDTGIGIEKEALSQIFDAFHQEKQGIIKGGTGLGLSITKQYVDLISGDLKVDSEPGKGSIFYFEIELEKADASFNTQVAEPENTNFSIISKQSLTAMIVEDNQDNTELLSNILKPLGFNLTLAENGQEALNAIKNSCPDIVFMDIRMPVMDGLEAIKKIRLTHSSTQLKCIAVTASTLQHSSKHYLDAGFDLFISKPYRFDEIYHAVKDILNLELTMHKQSNKPIQEKSAHNKSSPPAKIKLEQDFINRLSQAAEYSQLTELKNLLQQFNQYGAEGEIIAHHLELLINSADLDGISNYVEGVINEQNNF